MGALDDAIVQAFATPIAMVAALVAVYALLNRAAATAAVKGTVPPARAWFAPNASKRWGETFFLWYSAVWVTWFGWVVVSGVWERFAHVEYMVVCGAMALPCVLAPIYFQPAAEAARPWWSRYWVKANVWIAIISYVGNYLWTHYFYVLLGSSYTFPSWRINGVPIPMFLATHAYFCTYHTLTTMGLRRWWTSATYTRALPGWLRPLSTCALVCTLAAFTAFLEAFTIQGFPYYSFTNRGILYSVGLVVYGMYFVVSFPMFARLDEYADQEASGSDGRGPHATRPPAVGAGAISPVGAARGRSRSRSRKGAAPDRGAGASPAGSLPGDGTQLQVAHESAHAPVAAPAGSWTVTATALDALAGCMIVTLLLDHWRIFYLSLVEAPERGLPWLFTA